MTLKKVRRTFLLLGLWLAFVGAVIVWIAPEMGWPHLAFWWGFVVIQQIAIRNDTFLKSVVKRNSETYRDWFGEDPD